MAGWILNFEKKINEEVENGRNIEVDVHPRSEANKIPDLIRTKVNLLPPGLTEIRTVNISGLDLQADGGTHVNNTSEVGRIRITEYKSKGRINKRVKIQLD
jgi:misacylated tRNA(Ala) deacylase